MVIAIMTVVAWVLLNAGAVMLIRYGHVHFPRVEDETLQTSHTPNSGKE